MSTNDRINQIIRGCCAGNASLATDILTEKFVIIPRDELPKVILSDHDNGFVAALAQERYQPALRFNPEGGDKPGEWSRKIAYANLAIAEAVETNYAARDKRRDELAEEFMSEAAKANNLPAWDELNPTYQRAIDRIIELEATK